MVRDLAGLIHSGTTTERRLAFTVGISQPHLHNILNGTRKLTPAVADQVMERLEWSLLDLVETNEAQALVDRRQAELAHGRDTPSASLGVGKGLRFPGQSNGVAAIPIAWLAYTEDPLVVSAGEDEEMEPVIEAGDILLVDRSARARMQVDDDALYVVRTADGESVARWVRYSSRGLYLASAATGPEPSEWQLVTAAARRRLEIIEARIIAFSRPPGHMFQRPVRPFASS
jgi:hypothetical protein